MRSVEFGRVLLLSPAMIEGVSSEIEQVVISPLSTAAAYSRFVLNDLRRWVSTSHVLLIQWDSMVVDASAWDDRFLDYDYVGAPWPQFGDGHDVGNGGFSLRSRKLLDVVRGTGHAQDHPEDVFICRLRRAALEHDHGIRFAPAEIAGRFAYERVKPLEVVFGTHGLFNLPYHLADDELDDLLRSMPPRWLMNRDARDLALELISSSIVTRRAWARQVLIKQLLGNPLKSAHWRAVARMIGRQAQRYFGLSNTSASEERLEVADG